jgi:hypothetical protein
MLYNICGILIFGICIAMLEVVMVILIMFSGGICTANRHMRPTFTGQLSFLVLWKMRLKNFESCMSEVPEG